MPDNPPSANAAPSNSGIVTTDKGETFIPSSVRADGSVRKEIKVRAGYRPPEDVERYKNQAAEAWKSRGSGGVPGAEAVESEPSTSVSAAKNAKRREARKRAKEAGESKLDAPTGAEVESEAIPSAQEPITENDEQAAKEKAAKGLRKKLRQARELSARRDGGETLLPEQLEKVIRINELLRQLNALGLEAEEEQAS